MTGPAGHESPIACDLTALSPEQRRRHEELASAILQRLEVAEETGGGYTLRFSNDGALIQQLAEFMILERLCCPFLDFTLEVQREYGPVWLTLSGRDGVKDFLREELDIVG